ncbi:hypothetical protein SI65_06973 [Aspergillus cristatus]|uniref:Uncharacterized protein n=1 Tax=Aspergillus cristatus TaxID=573508 RepID=A0A1E3B8U4_ASPCR|nr:hypothetical protein SI65_06973 [Aspergillus cristatus]
MTDMNTLYQSAEAGNLADLDWYCQRYLNELVKKHDKTGDMELTYTIPQPDDYKHFTILHERDRYVGGGRVSATEDLQTVKGKVVEVVDAKRGYNRTLFGFAASTVRGLRCELFSVYFGEVKTLGGGPLSFRTDQDAIEEAVKHMADVWEKTY